MDDLNQIETAVRIEEFATIGFGEAASAFVSGLRQDATTMGFSSYDIKTDAQDKAVVDRKLQDYAKAGVTARADMAALLDGATMVFSLVTADQAQTAALEAAKSISAGCYYFDGNSCAPKTKQANAAVIEAAGGRYVDTAIMSPVHPKLHKSPIILSGPWADIAAEILTSLGMSATAEPGEVGRASSIKMVRSIMVKGLEALVAECVLAGRLAGVEDYVLDSLEASYPGFGWKDRSAYNLERMMAHGIRRAAEMREVEKTVQDLGLPGDMAAATTNWQYLIGNLALSADGDDYKIRADQILTAMKQP